MLQKLQELEGELKINPKGGLNLITEIRMRVKGMMQQGGFT